MMQITNHRSNKYHRHNIVTIYSLQVHTLSYVQTATHRYVLNTCKFSQKKAIDEAKYLYCRTSYIVLRRFDLKRSSS